MKKSNIDALKKHTVLYWSIVAIVMFLALNLLALLFPNLEEILVVVFFIFLIICTIKATSILFKMLPFILLLPFLLIMALIVSKNKKKREMIGGQ